MNATELNTKISKKLEEIRSEVTTFVKENAKFKIGDIILTKFFDGIDKKNYFVITQIGFDCYGIIYFGKRVIKSTGEISYQSMHSDIGIQESRIVKATLKVKGKEISRIEESNRFEYDIKIKLNV